MNSKQKKPSQSETHPNITLFQRLRSRFITGIVIAAPIGVTFFLIQFFINFIDARVKPLIPKAWNPETYLPFALPGLGVVVAIIALIILGSIATNLIGKSLINIADRVMGRIPVVSNLYSVAKQIIDTLTSNQSTSFKEVALVEYPKQGTWAIGFVSQDAEGEIDARLSQSVSETWVSVFVPTTPNPTSGFLMYLKRDEIIVLDMTIEEAAKLIISGGLITPPWGEDGIHIEAQVSK